MLKFTTLAVIAAAWPLSAPGVYWTGDMLFPDRPAGTVWLELAAVAWLLAVPWAVAMLRTLED